MWEKVVRRDLLPLALKRGYHKLPPKERADACLKLILKEYGMFHPIDHEIMTGLLSRALENRTRRPSITDFLAG